MQLKEMDKEHKKQLNIQRDDYESTIKRHLAFIDQLIDDKKVLTRRCEELVVKLKDVDQKYSTKMKQITEKLVFLLWNQFLLLEVCNLIYMWSIADSDRSKWLKSLL